MSNRIILSADSTCDLGAVLKQKYHVNYYPFHISLDGKEYVDNVDITPDDLFEAYWQYKQLPKTAAIGVAEYIDYFQKWTRQGYDVIHINLGGAISSTHHNCLLAAKELGNVYPIDSCSLSTGMGLLVLEAAERIAKGMRAEQIQREIQALTAKTHASFILDTLEFMRAGGRCSTVTALGANLLRLKPCIEVDNRDGSMNVGKKYRGDLDRVLLQYVRDKLAQRNDLRLKRAFIAHTGVSQERIQMVYNAMKRYADFKEIYVARASCTISCHCGPNTLGVMFMTK